MAWGPLKFWVQGTSPCTIGVVEDSIVAVANLPVMKKRPVGVLAVETGSRSPTGVPPRPAEMSVVDWRLAFERHQPPLEYAAFEPGRAPSRHGVAERLRDARLG